jgi:hypothetical protein
VKVIKETAEPSISAADSQPTLHDLERIIERGKATYLEVGEAMVEKITMLVDDRLIELDDKYRIETEVAA